MLLIKIGIYLAIIGFASLSPFKRAEANYFVLIVNLLCKVCLLCVLPWGRGERIDDSDDDLQ